MLRTILLRNQVIKENLKKTIRSNITRCISTELSRRKLSHKLLSSADKSLVLPQWNLQVRYYSDLPSHSKIPLPALSPTMESGTIVSWAKKEGDQLNEGDLLCEIETDKATMGFETPEEGYLAKILLPAGTKGVPVGKLLCIIVDSADKVAAFKNYKDDGAVIAPKAAAPAAAAPAAAPKPAAAPAPAPAPAPVAAPAPAPVLAATGATSARVYASPFARRLAENKKIRLEGPGSGLYGSVKSADVAGMKAGAAASGPVAAAPTTSPAGTFIDIAVSGMRATIAKRLSQSKQTIPHYQLSATVNMGKVEQMRKSLNEKLAAEKTGLKLSVNDFIVKAVAAACKRVPDVNAHWMESYIRQFTNVDVSVAVATPSGLITPILFNADSRGIIALSAEMKVLAAKAKEGKLQPPEFQGGTVTVSNLGMFGITMFNAIINPPQSLILACGGIQNIFVPGKDGPELGKFVTFTASADHRVIDGAVGARWMKALKENLEDPVNMIL